jgi:hypothetical protein
MKDFRTRTRPVNPGLFLVVFSYSQWYTVTIGGTLMAKLEFPRFKVPGGPIVYCIAWAIDNFRSGWEWIATDIVQVTDEEMKILYTMGMLNLTRTSSRPSQRNTWISLA